MKLMGLTPTDDNFGGWDLSGWVQEPRESPGTNISITSFVLLALRGEENDRVHASQDKARKWLKRVRNPDHGFHFHSEKNHAGNKAEWKDELAQQPRSYGSATVDGIRAMRALGFPAQQIAQSARWLHENSDSRLGVKIVPGFDMSGIDLTEFELSNIRESRLDRDSSWAQGLLFYYFAGLAMEKKSLPKAMQDKCTEQIPRYLGACQRKDGRWENSSARMREDDPLIATPFALIALLSWAKQ